MSITPNIQDYQANVPSESPALTPPLAAEDLAKLVEDLTKAQAEAASLTSICKKLQGIQDTLTLLPDEIIEKFAEAFTMMISTTNEAKIEVTNATRTVLDDGTVIDPDNQLGIPGYPPCHTTGEFPGYQQPEDGGQPKVFEIIDDIGYINKPEEPKNRTYMVIADAIKQEVRVVDDTLSHTVIATFKTNDAFFDIGMDMIILATDLAYAMSGLPRPTIPMSNKITSIELPLPLSTVEVPIYALNLATARISGRHTAHIEIRDPKFNNIYLNRWMTSLRDSSITPPPVADYLKK